MPQLPRQLANWLGSVMSWMAPVPVSFSVGWTTLSAGFKALPAAVPTKIGVRTPLIVTLAPSALPGCLGSNQSTATPAPARSVLQSWPWVGQDQPPVTITVTVPLALIVAVAS